jgi:hypothetical protein
MNDASLLQRTGSRDHSDRIKHRPTVGTQQKGVSSWSQSPPPKKVWVKPDRQKLSEKEVEQRRREMMDNAKWREKEREKNIASYKAQDEKEKKHKKEYNGNFLRYIVSFDFSRAVTVGRNTI